MCARFRGCSPKPLPHMWYAYLCIIHTHFGGGVYINAGEYNQSAASSYRISVPVVIICFILSMLVLPCLYPAATPSTGFAGGQCAHQMLTAFRHFIVSSSLPRFLSDCPAQVGCTASPDKPTDDENAECCVPYNVQANPDTGRISAPIHERSRNKPPPGHTKTACLPPTYAQPYAIGLLFQIDILETANQMSHGELRTHVQRAQRLCI